MKKFLITLTISWLMAAVSEAATYYVAKTGSNSNTCAQAQSQSTPRLTIAFGASCLVGGDTLYVKAGTYTETYQSIKLPKSTSWSPATTISTFGSDVVTLNGSPFNTFGYDLAYVIFNGFIYDGQEIYETAIATNQGPHHLRWTNVEIKNFRGSAVQGGVSNEFINCKVHDNGKHPDAYGHFGLYGFYMGGTNNLIDRCEVYNNGGYGIHIYNTSGGVHNNTVRNSIIHDNSVMALAGQPNMLIGSGDNNVAYNNVVYGGWGGIQVGYSSTNNKVYSNTIYGVANWAIATGDSSTNIIIKNNIMFGNGSDIAAGAATTVISNNLFKATNPLFVSAATHDFYLQPGSPARGAGADLFSLGVITDIAGIARPQGCCPDIGAYQYGSQSTPPSNLMAPTNLIAGP